MENQTVELIYGETAEERKARLRSRKIRKIREAKIPYHLVMILALAFIFVPLYIMVITSLTSEVESTNTAFSWWPKSGLTAQGYKDAFSRKMGGISLIGSFFNTMWIYLPSTVVGIFMRCIYERDGGVRFREIRFQIK